ncbi:hypothetical protein ACHAXA_005663 [Cyclostephanos tholiformis]|uniref:Uncharacterized protein n=1 Tax=Cyclostephanos tholiformis TaxID=382380 RepID=A0ABD3SQD6_9STRA
MAFEFLMHQRPAAWSILGATLIVAATTADDAIWLVRYTSPSLPSCTRIIHAALFVFTLELLTGCSVAVAWGLRLAVITTKDEDNNGSSLEGKWDDEIVLGSIGAGICYVIALVLYIRRWLKRRSRAASKDALHQAMGQSANSNYGSVDDFGEHSPSDDDSKQGHVLVEIEQDHTDEDRVPCQPSPLAVISFTTLGALDEISYFPSLLLGKIFTPLELCLGTFFAACIILIGLTVFLSHCKPVLDLLDQIPLYGIVLAFALVLTSGIILDFLSKGH